MNNFIWCDLSCLRPEAAASFYSDLFGWGYEGGPDEYRYALAGGRPVAALFDMPAFFRKINMPSFWMSYIAVKDAERVAQIARDNGGKVELEQDFAGGGKIALIRDPLGAGFTVYQGSMAPGAHGMTVPGLRAGHSLHVSNSSALAPFYNALFGWQSGEHNSTQCFNDADGRMIAEIYESSDEERGGFEYWGITFTVTDLDAAERAIVAQGGTIYSRTAVSGVATLAAADPDGAAFFVMQCI